MARRKGQGNSTERLTALAVEKLARKPGLYCDGGGLYLRVSSPTARSWVLRYMLDKCPHEMGLGKYPEITLAEARHKAMDARRLKANGTDPLAHKVARKAAAALASAKAMTFADCADAYIKVQSAGWRNPKHAAQWEATLRTYAAPVIGSLPVAAIDTGLIMRVLEQPVDGKTLWTARPETASRLRGRIENILDWATVRGFRDGPNPAMWRGRLAKLLPAKAKVRPVEHHAALPYGELPTFMCDLRRNHPGTTARALEFAILCANRTGEVLGATWSEIDLAAKLWTVPPERMKARREHRIPLSASALEILAAMKPDGAPDDGFVFPGAQAGRPLSNMAFSMLLRRMKRDDLTAHGLCRATFRTWGAEQTGFPVGVDVLEAALAHTQGKLHDAYQRGDLLAKRRALMTEWASYCSGEAGA